MPLSRDPDGRRILRLGARGSLLSRMQSESVARALEALHPDLRVDLIPVTTSGDQIQDRPLHEFGGKGLFTKELDLALLRGDVDFAVHSFKDVPVTMPLVDTRELVLAAVPEREDPRDLLVSLNAKSLADLPRRARVGTSSLRRQAQVLAERRDLTIVPIRGNIDTRLRKLRSGEFDAIILALAGVKRANLFDATIMTPLELDVMLPAAGQGALALQCRHDAEEVRALLQPLHHPDTAQAVDLEREIVMLLRGDCHSPIGALLTYDGTQAHYQTMVARKDGQPPAMRAAVICDRSDAESAPREALIMLRKSHALKILGL